MHDALRGRKGKPQQIVRSPEILRKGDGRASQAQRPGRWREDPSGWVFSGYIVLQLLDGLLLLRDDPLYQITDRDNPEYLVVFHNRKMTYAIVGHNRHALVHRLLLSNENHRARHDLPDLGLLRGSSHEDDLARIVPLRDDARQFALGDDQQRPNPRLGHPFDGLVDRLFRGHRPDITALVFQDRADPVAKSQHWRGTS